MTDAAFDRQTMLSRQPAFWQFLGGFHVTWATIDLTTDLAIGQFLGLPQEDTHLVVAGMMFGRKARLFADLVRRSDHPNKPAIAEAFRWIRGNNKREVIAHGYIQSTPLKVAFVERSAGDAFKARRHEFSLKEFGEHCIELNKRSVKLSEGLNIQPDAFEKFAEAALSLSAKTSKSSARPQSKA